jgi:colanic acid biosynthesis glycosyl transferase WcaI
LNDSRSAGGRLRVLFVNRYYAPDLSATSQLLTDLAEALARSGMEVGVVCSRQLYEDPRALLPGNEVIRGVTVWRMAGARFGRDRLLGRAVDYLTFYVAATAALLKLARDYDVLVMKTDPPLLSLIGWYVAGRRGVVCVNWLQDVFPEVAARIGGTVLTPGLARALGALRDRSLRHARVNVALGERMRHYLIARGVPAAAVRVAENWADEGAVTPMPPADSALRGRLSLSDRFVVAYSGNLGRAHDAATLFAGVEALRDDPSIVFLMTGGGSKMRWLEERARECGLTQLRFEPYQPRAALADTLAAGDVHLVSLLPQLEGLIVPSKFYGILAAGRPVVFVGDPDGELARLIRAHGVGIAVGSGDGVELARGLCALRDAPQERAGMGARARALFEQRYTLEVASTRWRQLLIEAAAAQL